MNAQKMAGNRSKLVCLNLVNTRSAIWRRSFKGYDKCSCIMETIFNTMKVNYIKL